MAKFSIFPEGVGKYLYVIVRVWPAISNSAQRSEKDSFRNSEQFLMASVSVEMSKE